MMWLGADGNVRQTGRQDTACRYFPSQMIPDPTLSAGLTFLVTAMKPHWEIGIAPSESISDEEKAQRLRDVLMAFRLRIAS